MRFDLHVHTARYSGCSRFWPEEMAQRALDEGLDGIVLTEHNQIWKDQEHAQLQASFPDLIILRGVEICSACGDDFLIYGTLDPNLFYHGMEAKELFAKAKAQNCAVVLAHPYRYREDVDPWVFRESKVLTAIECRSFHVRRYMEEPIRKLRGKLELPLFASSDAHDPWNVGLYGMEFPDPITTEKELAESLHQGRFRPFVDRKRAWEINTKLARELPLVKALLSSGRSYGEIYCKYPQFNWGMLNALKTNGELELLLDW